MSNKTKDELHNMVGALRRNDPILAERFFKRALDVKLGEALTERKAKRAAEVFGTRVAK